MPIGKNLNLKRDKVIPDKKKSVIKEQNAKDSVETLDIEENNFSIKVIPSKRKKVKKTNIELSGDLSITNIEKINEQIKPVFGNYDLVDMYLTNVDKYDLSTIQLLYTHTILHDTEDKSKMVKVIADLPIELKKLTQACGFSEFIYHYQG